LSLALVKCQESETEEPDHSASLGDFTKSSTRIGFSVHTGGLRTRKKAARKNNNVAFFSTAAEREEFESKCSKWLINKGVGALFPMASTIGLYQRNFLFDNVFVTDAANR
jgi:hypothetical protein